LAAIEALADLSTAVRVRDQAINAFGIVEDGYEPCVEEPASAGYACGEMLNEAPEQCCEVYRVAKALGNGNMQHGLTAILKLSSRTTK
jgi:hypothetical protein